MADNKTTSEYAIERAFSAEVESILKALDGKRVFPTNHPMAGESNVLTTTVSFDGQHFVIPTMVDGKDLREGNAFSDLAQEKGLENYPVYNNLKLANEVSKRMHGGVLENGIFSYKLAKENL